MQDTKLKTYNVKVVVQYEYEVEVENADEAEQEGWNYENYAHFASVYSIDTEELDTGDDDE